jgi:Ca-activated chloride channel family protein
LLAKPSFLFLVCLALVLGPLLSGCSDDSGTSSSGFQGNPISLNIVAGSESKEIEDIILDCGRRNKIAVEMHYSGSVDTMLALRKADFAPDAALPASSIWLRLGDAEFHRVKEEASIMRSPVGLGIKKPLARELGWIGREVTVADILEAVRSRKLRFAMTSATQSNSGFSSYVGMLIALAGNPDVLTTENLEDKGLQKNIRNLLSGVNRGSGSSGWLMHTFIEDYARLDAMFNYESMIIAANKRLIEQGKEPLYIIYPADGLAVADSTLGFIDKPDQPGNQEKKEAFVKLRDCLLSDEVQEKILKRGFRAGLIGMNPDKAPKEVYRAEWGIDLGRTISPIVWPEAAVTERALNLYQTSFRKPSLTVFALDCSGSMKDGGLADLKRALAELFDPATASRYLIQTGDNDLIVILPFDHDFLWTEPLTVRGSDPAAIRNLVEAVQSLQPRGKTDIYKPVGAAWRYFISLGEKLEDYLPSVILMTDGNSNLGSLDGLRSLWQELNPTFQLPPVFCIMYGQANDEQLKDLAAFSFGRVFDGRHGGLYKAFRKAKGYN